MDAYEFVCFYANCSKRYNTKFNLERHINIAHLNIRNFVCPHCSKRFPTKQNMREHGYIHTNEKPFGCRFPGCSKRYRQSSQLTVHHKTHARKGEWEASLWLPDLRQERKVQGLILPLPPALQTFLGKSD